ncbi:MAG: exodeoxyribonuclease VII small subunit [Anaerolineales bacterium]
MIEIRIEDIQEMDFETAFTALQENVTLLEGEDLPLEKALTLFERGQQLAKHCSILLDQAELKVRELSLESTQLTDKEA